MRRAADGCARVLAASMFPSADVGGLSVTLDEAPSYRHRGICIEGAVSYENVAEMIDWAAEGGAERILLPVHGPVHLLRSLVSPP